VKIDWTGFATTKGGFLRGQILDINHYKPMSDGPFIIGWDHYSDGWKVEYWMQPPGRPSRSGPPER
jgi:hypothetical protein